MMNVDIKEDSSNGNKVSVQCLIKCVHREVLKLEGSTLDISIDLTPLAPHDHLLDPKRVSSQVVLERPADVFRMKRRVSDEEGPIVSQTSQEEHKKVRGQMNANAKPKPQTTAEEVRIYDLPEFDPKREPQEVVLPRSQNSLASPIQSQSQGRTTENPRRGGYEINKPPEPAGMGGEGLSQSKAYMMKSKSVSISELEEFIDGNIDQETEEEYLNVDSEKSGRLGKNSWLKLCAYIYICIC